MNETSRYRLVGIIAVSIVLILFGLLIKKSIIDREKTERYRLIFNHAAGLNIHDPVFLNGYKVGKVQSVSIHNSRALVEIDLKHSARIAKDANISIEFYGLTGSLKISITNPPDSDVFYPVCYTRLIEGNELLPFETYSNKLKDFADNVYGFSEYLLKISTGIANLEDMKLNEFQRNINEFNQDLSRIEISLGENLIKFDETVRSVPGSVKRFNKGVTRITDSLQTGKDTFSGYSGFQRIGESRLFQKDSELSRNFSLLKKNYNILQTPSEKQIEFQFNTLYNQDNNYIQDLRLRTIIDGHYYYLLGFNFHTVNTGNEDKPEIDLMIGRTQRHIVYRLGLVESTTGLGMSYVRHPFSLGGEIYNLGENTYFRSYLQYTIFENFNLVLGFRYTGDELFYSGLGLRWDDDDIREIFHVLNFLKTGE